RHKRTEFVLADNHAAGMLAKMPRQSINRVIQPDECRHAWVRLWQTGLLNLRFELERVREIAAGKQMRKTIDDAWGKIKRFANLPRRTASAIADDICRHRCAVFAIASINFLNDCFPAIAAGKIEIDIRPAFAAFIQKTFEN